MITESLSYSYAFMLGLLSSAHCVGMCGGIVGAFSLSIPAQLRTPLRLMLITLAYNMGRIITYTTMGLLLGGIAQFLQSHSTLFTLVVRFIAGITLIVMGLYLSQLWYGLTWIEKAGQFIWRRIQPLTKRFIPVDTLPRAVTLGMLWGFLPCGLVYSVLLWAISANSSQQSALIMFCFGLGSLPALITLGVFSNLLKKFIRAKTTRLISGMVVIGLGLWTLWFTYQHTMTHVDMHDHSQMEQQQ